MGSGGGYVNDTGLELKVSTLLNRRHLSVRLFDERCLHDGLLDSHGLPSDWGICQIPVVLAPNFEQRKTVFREGCVWSKLAEPALVPLFCFSGI